MPVTIVEKLPLPSLKVYTAGSVLLLSASVYYALSVTSDPGWRVNATLQRQVSIAERDGDTLKMVTIAPHNVASNGTRNFTEQFVELMSFMMQEPLCMWSVINAACCSLALLGFLIQRLVFGKLRVSEAQRVKDKFWNYVFYKFIFVFGVINVQFMDEVLLWCTWFTLVGSIHLLGQLCKDRFEYLSSSPNTSRWAHIRLLCLLGCILAGSAALLAVAAAWGLPAGRDTFAFMAAECVLVVISALHVVARYMLQAYEADAAGPVAYYTHLVFDCTSLCVELANVIHMVVWSNMLVSMASLVLLMQLRHLLHELQARGRRHRLYTALTTHMSRNYPMASKEEVEQNQDNCAICWEPMKEARKLPCSHLFHNSCLCQWVQQDASCPTCRRALRAGSGPRAAPGQAARPHPNHLFHFDGSRYVSWLPSFSVEVTRVRAELPPPPLPPLPSHLDAMATQVQQMFPNYPLGALVADLASTRSAELTVENILEGRLLLPRIALPLDTQATEPPSHEIRELAALAPAPMSPGATTAGTPLASTSVASAITGVDNDRYGPEPESISNQFAEESTERETMLRRRKEQLLAAARRRYLSRARAGHS